MTNDDCALMDVFSLLSDISSPVILHPWCIDFGELLSDLPSTQSVCLKYVKYLTSQDLKTTALTPDNRAASQQLLCPLKRGFFPKLKILKVFWNQGIFLLRISAKFISLHFFTLRQNV